MCLGDQGIGSWCEGGDASSIRAFIFWLTWSSSLCFPLSIPAGSRLGQGIPQSAHWAACPNLTTSFKGVMKSEIKQSWGFPGGHMWKLPPARFITLRSLEMFHKFSPTPLPAFTHEPSVPCRMCSALTLERNSSRGLTSICH